MFNLTLKLSENIRKRISLIGTISTTPWQHLIKISETHEIIDYLDLEDGEQIVIYSRIPIKCEKKVQITGKVIEVTGKSKRPDRKRKEIHTG